MFIRVISNLLPLSLGNARVGVINHRFSHSFALNIGVNVFSFFVSDLLIAFRADPQDGTSQRNLCDVIFYNAFVVAYTINRRTFGGGFV